MPKLTASQIIGALPALKATERAAVKAALEGLLTTSDAATPLYDALMAAMGIKMAYGRFQSMTVYRAWGTKSAIVTDFVETTFPGITKVANAALLRLLLDGLISRYNKRKIPVTVTSVVNGLDSIPGEFDAMFPGYRQQGLAHLVLKAILKGG